MNTNQVMAVVDHARAIGELMGTPTTEDVFSIKMRKSLVIEKLKEIRWIANRIIEAECEEQHPIAPQP